MGRQRTKTLFKHLDGFERCHGDSSRHVGQDSGVPFGGSGGSSGRPFREGANFDVAPALLRVDLAGIDLKFDVARRRGKGGADRFVHGPILHRRGGGFDVSAQCFRSHANVEEFLKGTPAGTK